MSRLTPFITNDPGHSYPVNPYKFHKEDHMELLKKFSGWTKTILQKARCSFHHPKPYGLQLEITNQCNFRCAMCPFHSPVHSIQRPKGFMPVEAYDKILSEFTKMGGKFLIPQGAGEPFLHPQIMTFLDIAKSRYHLKVGLNTNGSLLKSDHIDALMTLCIDDIGFSIDALTPDSFEEITGSKKLSDIESIVCQLIERRKQRNQSKPFVRVLIVEQETNQNQINDYIAKWVDIVDEVIVQTMRIQAGRKLMVPRIEDRRPCRHIFDTIFIQWNGDVVICCEDWESKTVIGNAIQDRLSNIWYSPILDRFRKMQLSGIYTMPEICTSCEAWAGGRESRQDSGEFIVRETALTRSIRRKQRR